MPERATISVVIPTYQRREMVHAAVESALAQREPAEQVIVVDDGSTDGTADRLRARFGDRLLVITRANGGPSAARNSGIAAATGDVVAFLDSDNRWLPEHLVVIRDLSAAHPDSVLVSTQRQYRFGNERIGDEHSGDVARDLIAVRTCVGLMTSLAVRRQAVVDVSGFDETLWYGEDLELFLRLALLGPFTMLRARTLVRGAGPASLRARGMARGEYTRFVTTTGRQMVERLRDCDRPDAEKLREAAAARVAIGELFELLDRSGPTVDARRCFTAIRRLVPEHAREPGGIVYSLPWHITGWESRRRRGQVARRLIAAWGRGPIDGTARLWAATAHIAAMGDRS